MENLSGHPLALLSVLEQDPKFLPSFYFKLRISFESPKSVKNI